MKVPYFRPDLREAEIDEVVDTLRSGWLTSGPRVSRFEEAFAAAVGAEHALAVCSCTAALHLAVEALGLCPGQAVLVPTMTFAATAEVVRYQGAIPILVDCDPVTGHIDLADAQRKIARLRGGGLSGARAEPETTVVGMIVVHVGGSMADLAAARQLCDREGLWLVEDAAHAFPASWRPDSSSPWQRCGEGTADVTCFSFYANKTITTGEGGMAVTDNAELAARMKVMSLHGLSKDAWGRYSETGSWDYRIVAPGFKYNLTDIAAAIGLHQLDRAEEMRQDRARLAERYAEAFAAEEAFELPPSDPDRIHSWHLFPVRLRLDRLPGGREGFLEDLRAHGIGFSVHWRPLHLHPYYAETLGWPAELFPGANEQWPRLVSLPIFPSMTEEEQDYVVHVVRTLCRDRALA